MRGSTQDNAPLRKAIADLARRTGREYTAEDFATILGKPVELTHAVAWSMATTGELVSCNGHELAIYQIGAEKRPAAKPKMSPLERMLADADAIARRMGKPPRGYADYYGKRVKA